MNSHYVLMSVHLTFAHDAASMRWKVHGVLSRALQGNQDARLVKAFVFSERVARAERGRSGASGGEVVVRLRLKVCSGHTYRLALGHAHTLGLARR